MNIAFLVTRLEKPSARYRVLQYLPFMKKAGITPEVCTIPKNHLDRIMLFRKMRNYDLVFLQKKLFTSLEWKMLRKNARKLVYDFDDAVMFRDSQHRIQVSSRRLNNFVRTVKNADGVIAGNEYLRTFAIGENPNTHVIPTPIDMDRYTERPSGVLSDGITLGWIGSSATLFYLEKLKNIWDSVFDRFPHVHLKIVADRFFDCGRMPIIKKRWKYEEEIDDLHSFDIGLMPLTDDPWSRGKCGFKLLQYMAVGVPAIGSPVGVNEEIVTDGENGFLAATETEWLEKLGNLIQNTELRYHMGRRARDVVIRRYATNTTVEKLITLFGTC